MSTINQSRDDVMKEKCYANEKKKEALRKIEESEQIMAKEETKVKNLVLEVMEACDAKIAAIPRFVFRLHMILFIPNCISTC